MRRLIAALICTSGLAADIANGNYFPMGDRAAFMANTACADGRSSMAVFFNPGALGFVERSKIALSGNLYFNLWSDFEPLVRYNGESQNVRISGFNSVPNSAVSIYKWGETTLAVSVLVPEFYQSGTLQKINLTGYNAVLQFDTRQQDLWLGVTVARVWREKYGVGISVFGTRYTSYLATSLTGNYLVSGSPVSATAILHRDGAAHSVESVIGFYWKPESWLATGIKLSPPGIRINGSGTYYSGLTVTSGSAQASLVEDKPDLSYYYHRPAQLSLGLQIEPITGLRWYLDGNLQFPVSFQELPGASQPGNYDLQTTMRFSSGLEYQFNKTWSALSGFGFFPSAVPAVEPRYAGQSRLTGFLVSGGLIYSDEHVRTGLGAFYLFMDGGQQVDTTAGNTTHLQQRGLGALLTSSYEF